MKSDPKLIVIGIEVASPELLQGFMEDGYLPTFRKCSENGLFSPLHSITEISSGSIWPSFATGTTPFKNNQFFTHMQLQSGTYKIRKKYANDIPVPFFWRELEAGGKKTCVIDVAQTRPESDLTGTLVAGWGAEYPGWKRASNPPALIRELVGKYKSHPLCDAYRLSISPENRKEYDRLIKNLHLGIDRKIALTKDLFARQDWDFFLTIFPETHWATHLLYHTLDKGSPDLELNVYPDGKDVFGGLLRKIDACLKRLMELRPEAAVIVFSGSGMGPNYSGIHLLEEVLERIPAAEGEPQLRKSTLISSLLPSRRWKGNKVRGIENLVSVGILENLKKLVPKLIWDRVARQVLFAGSGWNRKRAFALPNDYSGAIRINLKGREPEGQVAPGIEYQALCRELTEELYKIVNLDTGKPAVKEVISVARLYGAVPMGDLPDLIVKWCDERPIRKIESPTIGRLSKQSGERRPGAHRDFGFLIAQGDRIDSSLGAKNAGLLDLVPTFFSLLNVPIPKRFEGRVLPFVHSA